MENSIKIKEGVIFKEINKYTLEFLLALDFCCQKYKHSYTITSAYRPDTGLNSYHDDSMAWDIRLNDTTKAHWYVLRDTMKSSLGKYFDIIIESEDTPNCHMHCECDLNKLADWYMEQDHND